MNSYKSAIRVGIILLAILVGTVLRGQDQQGKKTQPSAQPTQMQAQAQTQAPAPVAPVVATPATPVITVELRAKFWRASANVLSAQQNLTTTQNRFKVVMEELKSVCGATTTLQESDDGEPTCVASPVAVTRESSPKGK